MLLFNGKRPDTALAALMNALTTTTAGVSAVMCTQQSAENSCWLALRTNDIFNDPRQLDQPEATFISQFAF